MQVIDMNFKGPTWTYQDDFLRGLHGQHLHTFNIELKNGESITLRGRMVMEHSNTTSLNNLLQENKDIEIKMDTTAIVEQMKKDLQTYVDDKIIGDLTKIINGVLRGVK